MSRAEALDQEAEYLAKGWERTEEHKDADLIIVRGCSVTQRAQRDCERLIAHIRKKYPLKHIIVTGCLKDAKKDAQPSIPTPQPIPTRTARAYLKVQDGCSGRCTFCIVPKFRGTSTSVDFDAVIDRARRFIEAGYAEIVVTGCNLSLYASKGNRLDALIAALAEISPACRIRLGSLEPSPVAIDVVRTMAKLPNVCRFLHVPVQSGSNGILSAMRRPYLIHDVELLLREARKLIPGIAIGCDLMTGFPGETDYDFLATIGFLERNPVALAHVFPFSSRPGTIAAALHHKIPHEIARARARELVDRAEKSRLAFARRLIGRTVEIVVEDEKECAGWTSEYLWCSCPNRKAPRKSMIQAYVRATDGTKLVGQILPHGR